MRSGPTCLEDIIVYMYFIESKSLNEIIAYVIAENIRTHNEIKPKEARLFVEKIIVTASKNQYMH